VQRKTVVSGCCFDRRLRPEFRGAKITRDAGLLAVRELDKYASVGFAVSVAFSLYAWKKIGGLTGDTLGACVEITELAALFAFLTKP
jgi:hypothetical protein